MINRRRLSKSRRLALLVIIVRYNLWGLDMNLLHIRKKLQSRKKSRSPQQGTMRSLPRDGGNRPRTVLDSKRRRSQKNWLQ